MYFNNLKELRNDKDYTQQDIAEKLGVNRFTYKNWENGIVMIPIDIADKLSVFYNVKLSYILGIDKSSKIDYKVKSLKYDKLLRNLLKLKKDHNNSYEEIGAYLGCTRSTCQRYFKGIVKIPMDRLVLLSELYEIDLDELCCKK